MAMVTNRDVDVSSEIGDRPDRGLVPFLLAGLAGALALVTLGLLLRDRVPAVDAWGVDALRMTPGSGAETAVAATSDWLRNACVAAAVAATGWLLWCGRRQAVLPALGCVALFLLLAPSSELLKDVFDRPHPTDPADVSYPSTHVTTATVAVVIAAGILASLARRWRTWLVVLAVSAVVVTAATRVLLGEHYVTDVGAAALGYTGVTLLGRRLVRLPAPQPDAVRLRGTPGSGSGPDR